jgi:hypothetical protein
MVDVNGLAMAVARFVPHPQRLKAQTGTWEPGQEVGSLLLFSVYSDSNADVNVNRQSLICRLRERRAAVCDRMVLREEKNKKGGVFWKEKVGLRYADVRCQMSDARYDP